MLKNDLELYARRADYIWTDPHLAKGMLAAHLDESHDAATRGPASVDATVAWIRQASEGRRRLLDLGCGPGVYARRFHDAGYAVIGVDISAGSIAYAKEAAAATGQAIEYRVADYLRDPLGGPYELATCIYCDLGALTPPERDAFLARVRGALSEGGLFFFDVFGPGLCARKREGRSWSAESGGGFWSPKPHIELSEERHFPAARAWGSRSVIIEEGAPGYKEFITWDTYYDEAAIEAVLEGAGFELEEIKTGLVAGNGFTSDDVLFVKARKA